MHYSCKFTSKEMAEIASVALQNPNAIYIHPKVLDFIQALGGSVLSQYQPNLKR
jgi:hypothetical protein